MSDRVFINTGTEVLPPTNSFAGFDVVREAAPVTRRGTIAVKGETDSNLPLTRAQYLQEEMASYAGMRPEATVMIFNGTKMVPITVRERLEQLPAQINREFESARVLADKTDSLKASKLLVSVSVQMALKHSTNEPMPLRGFEDTRVRTLDFDTKTLFRGPTGAGRKPDLTKFSMDELYLLKYRLEEVIAAPRVIREKQAAFLAEQGDLNGAKKLLNDSVLYGGGPNVSPEQHFDLALRLKRKEVAGGIDPLETARLGARAQAYQKTYEAESFFNQAGYAADRLKPEVLRARLQAVEDELTAGKSDSKRTEELQLEKMATEELLHAPAVVRFSQARFAISQGHFARATNLVEHAAKIDPQLVADHQGMYLNMLLHTRTEGKEQSVFEFHNHLVNFQRNLSPHAFSIEGAQRELNRAQEEVKKLPFDAIENVRKSQTEKAATLEAELGKAVRDADKKRLTSELEETTKALQGLDILAHAPAYVRLMDGVFALCNKKNAEALAIFDEVEKFDPEYAKSASAQLIELRKFANLPETYSKQESMLRTLLKEFGYTAAAIAAGALVVVATGWTGPAALVAGFAAGSATRTGLKYMIEGEIKWYDPLLGGLDGLSGGAGALIYRSTVSGLNGTGHAIHAAERAMYAVSVDSATLQGLQGAQRFEAATRLAYGGLREMGSALPWYSKLPLIGNPAYREAAGFVSRVGRMSATNRFIANAAGGATTALLHRGREYAPKALDGSFNSTGDFLLAYGADVMVDTGFSSSGGFLLGKLSPRNMDWGQMTPLLYGQRNLVLEGAEQRKHLEQIEALIQELNAPTTPTQIRRWYLETPGPKVDLYPPQLKQ